jgi:phosphoribosylaminoimidazole-succinocarboxamide synthase
MSSGPKVLIDTELSLPLFRRGKVRDVYDLGDKLLIVSTDRISAFDVVLPCGIPGKGRVLNQLSAFWFKETADIFPNHVIKAIDTEETLRDVLSHLTADNYELKALNYLIGRSMFVSRAERIPIECVVRGYLFGSAWV